MRLSEYEQMNLLKEFPNVELSYDQIIHKTVQLPKLQQQQQAGQQLNQSRFLSF